MTKVYIGDDLLVTGYTDCYGVSVGPSQHEISISGRGMCQDLVDCSADLINSPDLRSAVMNGKDALEVATKLAKPFGIKARWGDAVTDHGKPIRNFMIENGQTSYEVLERAARYAGYLIYEDESGNVVLDVVGTKKMGSGFACPGNIETAASMLSINQRFSEYLVLWSPVANYKEYGQVADQRADVKDPTMPRYRPRIIISEQLDPDSDLGTRRANWELARRLGRSQAIQITCDNWRDANGKVWTPNYRAKVDAVALKMLNAEWVISTVVFRKDNTGTHADLTLMPPEAFEPMPAPLTQWDLEMGAPMPASQGSSQQSSGRTSADDVPITGSNLA
jgi:prophage tail gpP-like protein